MKVIAFLLMLALVVPVVAQDKQQKKAAAKRGAHAKPTPQQIRKFDELEKKKQRKFGDGARTSR